MFAQTIETNLRRILGAGVISLTLLIATASEEDLRKAFSHKLSEISLAKEPFLR
jgi:hypothetical protein